MRPQHHDRCPEPGHGLLASPGRSAEQPPRGNSASAQASATCLPGQSAAAVRELGLLRGASGQGRTLSTESRSGTAEPSAEPQRRPGRDVGGAGIAAPALGMRGRGSDAAAAVTFHVPSPRRGALADTPIRT